MADKKDDAMLKNAKATAFDWVFKALIGVVLWLVADMHADLKSVMNVIPVMQVKIDYLEDGQLKARLNAIPPIEPGKHEEPITYDSLIHK